MKRLLGWFKRNFFTAVVFLFIFLGLIVRNYHLRKVFFYDWDEGIYAQVATEILKNRSLITTFNGHLWLNKPPLSHLLIALIFAIFGRSEFWARMVMVGFSFALLIVTYFLTKKTINILFKKGIRKTNNLQRQLVFIIPVLILASTEIFLERSTILNTDTMLAVSWVGYLLFRERFYLKLFFLTLGVLTKSLLGFYPVFLEIFFLKRDLVNRDNLVKAFVLVSLPLTWHIFSLLKFGDYFIKAHLMDNLIKRVTAPIELHFGGRLYYPLLLWKNLGFFSLLLGVSYFLIFIDLAKIFFKKGKKVLQDESLFSYLVLLWPLPFFTLLVFGQSKIFWYMTPVFPLFSLSYGYLYFRLRNIFFRFLLVFFIFTFFLIRFIPHSYLEKKKNYTLPEKLVLAKCLSNLPVKKIGFLVNEDERKIRNVLEAAHLETETSFIYGGSPSFVFYSRKGVDYFYNIDRFLRQYRKYKLIVVSRKDLNLLIKRKRDGRYFKTCQTKNWVSFRR